MERFGEKLRTLRKRRGLTLRELAEALAYPSHGYLGNLESGRRKPTLAMALKIAAFFNLSVERLANDQREIDE
jgi:transcriptional regulator with XRE-family HTH domain